MSKTDTPLGFDGLPRDVLTVSDLTARLASLIETEFSSVKVVGEVSRVTYHASGHIYLALKDAGARIDAVIWRSTAGRLRFKIETGEEFVARLMKLRRSFAEAVEKGG